MKAGTDPRPMPSQAKEPVGKVFPTSDVSVNTEQHSGTEFVIERVTNQMIICLLRTRVKGKEKVLVQTPLDFFV